MSLGPILAKACLKTKKTNKQNTNSKIYTKELDLTGISYQNEEKKLQKQATSGMKTC